MVEKLQKNHSFKNNQNNLTYERNEIYILTNIYSFYSFYSDRTPVHSTHAGHRSECEDLNLSCLTNFNNYQQK